MKKIINIRSSIIYVLMIILIILTGCANRDLSYESHSTYNELIDKSDYGNLSVDFTGLTGEEIRTFKTSHNKEISFNYTYLVTKGKLNVQIRNGEDKILFDFMTGEEEYNKAKKNIANEYETEIEAIDIGEFGSSMNVQSDDGLWKIVLIGEKADGKIDISW